MSNDTERGDLPGEYPTYRPPWQRPLAPADVAGESSATDPPDRQGDATPERRGGPGTSARASRRSALMVAGLGLAAALVGGVAGGGVVAYFDRDGAAGTDQAAPAATGPTAIELTGAIVEAATSARPAVVRIESTRTTAAGREQDVGSGVVFDLEGHIVTNAHVVLETDSLKVVLADGTERPAVLVGHDFPFNDIAVLQIGPLNLKPLPIGDSSALRPGETVVAIGNPLGQFDGSISVGVVSGIAREQTFDGVRQEDLIQTDAALNNGNSGGALVNLAGQFVGMPTAVLRQSSSGQAVNGIAFALPSSRIVEIANRIIANGGAIERPSLGIEHIDLTAEALARLPRLAVNEGAVVAAVASGGPAAEAGIKPGDIIVELGGAAIDEETPLYNALMEHVPGETVRVVLNRNGRIIDVEVRLAKRS